MLAALPKAAEAPERSAFNNPEVVFEGWYWALPSRALKRGQVKALTLAGRELAIWRGEDGAVRAADAHCPHMGAHLALGRVEGAGLRCFFHGWRFDQAGACDEIPALGGQGRPGVCLRTHQVRERFGLIWIWVGDGAPSHEVPLHPLLAEGEVEARLVSRWTKACHPTVMMINAIDEHHFQTVHRMPGQVLRFRTESVARQQFRVLNEGSPPRLSWLWRAAAWAYRDQRLYYEINYFSASTGCVSLGPSWARMHLMFATRPGADGGTEGVTVALAPARRGLRGRLVNAAMLTVTAVAGAYFAHGDTKVFQSIRFDLKTPVPADRTVTAFMRHVERQAQATGWREAR